MTSFSSYDKISRVAAPRLPNAPTTYDQQFGDQLTNALRLYFNRLDSFFTQLRTAAQSITLNIPYLAVQSTVSQSVTANTANVMTFNTLDYANACSLVSNSRFTVTVSGVYNIQFSTQFQNTDSQLHDVSVWLRKNGTDIVGSTGVISIPNSHGGTPGHTISGWNFFVVLNANDYIELYWSTDNAAVTIEAYAAGVSPTRPSTASNVATIYLVCPSLNPLVYPDGKALTTAVGSVSVTT